MRFAVAAIIALALCIAGCRDTAQPAAEEYTMKVEVLGFESCPNTPVLRQRISDAIQLAGIRAEIHEIDQELLPEDDLRRGWPAPTALVNGRDLFGLPAPTSAAMGCRMYPGSDSLPDVDSLAAALGTALNRDLVRQNPSLER